MWAFEEDFRSWSNNFFGKVEKEQQPLLKFWKVDANWILEKNLLKKIYRNLMECVQYFKESNISYFIVKYSAFLN